MNRTDRARQAEEDEAKLANGLDPLSRDPAPVVGMARLMHALFERAKREKTIDPPIQYLYEKVTATLPRVGGTLACGKGCSHCCHTWVSATAPEVLYVAKLLRRRNDAEAVAKVRAAHLASKGYSFAVRALHPEPCPMLKDDLCTVYDARPVVCRFASSTDAFVCRRSIREFSRETVPMPLEFQQGRGVFGLVVTAALKHAGLPHHYYEYNGALESALSREDAERAWLSGEDIFSAVRRDPIDVAAHPQAELLYRHAFF